MEKNKKYILLVDDDEDDRIFFEEVLEDLDNPVIFKSAEHGLNALQLLENHMLSKPDAIFLDLNMPVLDGHECLKIIRSKSEFNTIKVIIYSTSYNPQVANVLKNDGANYYIQKPSDYLSLTRIIQKALEIIYDASAQTTNFLISN